MNTRNLFGSVAIAALAISLPANAQDGQSGDATAGKLEPFYGRISPFYGRISPFQGDITPFWGRISPFENGETDKINPFWGRISPFEGDIESFWGRISPFQDNGELEPFWGRISPFWGRISPFMGDLQANWGRISPFDGSDPASHEELANQFRSLISQSEEFWGEKVSAATGQNFWDGFASDVFADFGIDLDDPTTFDGFSDVDRSAFLFAWYDGLMGFSGLDHVDHWMETANWTPSLTQIQGGGTGTVIGLIDFAVTPDADLQDNIMMWSGSDSAAGGHGGAVASLLVADHDGKGLMGIAPNASVALYNPFDSDGTASWASVRRGVIEVGQAGASVVNMSLGVPGTTFDADWLEVYGDANVQPMFDNTVFVHAAGNDGLAQTTNLNWDADIDPSLIIVGSVGPNGNISAFSNTPGNACLVAKNKNHCETYLMDRFIVAPGEWILVTDGEGGVTRMSGTSFAAPLVTGAIALLHDRWGWLKEYPEETVDIIFETADDLGSEGVDPVYGHGLLNIEASQSPLDFGALYQLVTDDNGKTTKNYLGDIGDKKVEPLFNTDDGYVTVLEDVGATYRDFLIPLDELVTGIGLSIGGDEEELQAYLAAAFADLGNVGTSSKGKKAKDEKTKLHFAGIDMDMRTFALPLVEQNRPSGLPVASEFSMTSAEGVTFAFGNGVGAMSLTGNAAASTARFDPMRGGANPVLGLASGGGYARVDIPVLGNATMTFGATEREFEDGYVDPQTGEWRLANASVPTYEAAATYVSVEQPITETLSLSAGYTRLSERSGALGVRSSLQGAFDGGTVTDAMTVSTDWQISDRISVSGSATFGQSNSNDAFGSISLGQDGVSTTAFEGAMSFDGFLTDNDRARIALVQPMHIEDGALSVTNMQVVDRRSGQLENVTTAYGLTDERVFALEAGWGTSILEGAGDVSGFVRLEADRSGNFAGQEHLGGVQIRLRY